MRKKSSERALGIRIVDIILAITWRNISYPGISVVQADCDEKKKCAQEGAYQGAWVV